MLGHEQAAGLLKDILDQEKTADETLTELARTGNNEEALDGEADDSDAALRKASKGRSLSKRVQPVGK